MIIGNYGPMGQSAMNANVNNEFLWGGDASRIEVLRLPSIVSSAARDAGSAVTTVLRSGLIMGQITASGKAVQFDPTATDGSQIPVGILEPEIFVTDGLGQATDRQGVPLIVRAPIKAANVYILGASLVGHAAEYYVRWLFAQAGFRFDDDPMNVKAGLTKRYTTKAANYTVLASDNGTQFQAITGDVTFTLPAIKLGLRFSFLRVADFEMVVASAEGGNMLVGNDDAANSITFTTAGQQIGAQIDIECQYVNGTLKWVPTLPYVPFGTGLATMAFAIAT